MSYKITNIEITDDVKKGISRKIFATIDYESKLLFFKTKKKTIKVFADWSNIFEEILSIRCLENGKYVYDVLDFNSYESIKSELFRKLYTKPLDNNK